MEVGNDHDERERAVLPRQPIARQCPHVAACVDRDLRCSLSRLPHRCGRVPERQSLECPGQQLASLTAVRW